MCPSRLCWKDIGLLNLYPFHRAHIKAKFPQPKPFLFLSFYKHILLFTNINQVSSCTCWCIILHFFYFAYSNNKPGISMECKADLSVMSIQMPCFLSFPDFFKQKGFFTHLL